MPAFLPVALSGRVSPRSTLVQPGGAARQPSTATCAIVPDGGSCVCRAPTGDINGHRFDAQCYGEPRSELVKETITPHATSTWTTAADGVLRRLRPQQHEALPARYRLNIDQEIPPREDEVYTSDGAFTMRAPPASASRRERRITSSGSLVTSSTRCPQGARRHAARACAAHTD
mgnify:CR=1 FL=1